MSNHKSFTLIELLIVIAIIGVLSAIVITSMSNAVTKSRIVRLQVFSDTIRAQLSDSLVSWWSFNEGSGTTVYDQWEGNNGTLGGDPEWKSGGDCVSGKCLEFDGNGDWVDCGTTLNFGADDFTISVWLYRHRYIQYQEILSKGLYNQTGQWYLYNYSSDDNWNFYGDISKRCEWTMDECFNKWALLVITRENDQMHVYVNGNEKTRTADTISGTNADFTNTKHLAIGARSPDGIPDRVFNGIIDEVRIYNSAATITQIQSQYLAGLDKLLSNGAISKSEYNQRIKELSKEIVIE